MTRLMAHEADDRARPLVRGGIHPELATSRLAAAPRVDLRDVGNGTVSGTSLYRVAGFGPLALAGIADIAKATIGPLLAGSDRPALAARRRRRGDRGPQLVAVPARRGRARVRAVARRARRASLAGRAAAARRARRGEGLAPDEPRRFRAQRARSSRCCTRTHGGPRRVRRRVRRRADVGEAPASATRRPAEPTLRAYVRRLLFDEDRDEPAQAALP